MKGRKASRHQIKQCLIHVKEFGLNFESKRGKEVIFTWKKYDNRDLFYFILLWGDTYDKSRRRYGVIGQKTGHLVCWGIFSDTISSIT